MGTNELLRRFGGEAKCRSKSCRALRHVSGWMEAVGERLGPRTLL